jgi:hypothetical protein
MSPALALGVWMFTYSSSSNSWLRSVDDTAKTCFAKGPVRSHTGQTDEGCHSSGGEGETVREGQRGGDTEERDRADV